VNTSIFDGAIWRKSSYSGQNGTCVEVAALGSLVGVRDSKSTTSGHLALATHGWHKLVDAVKNDQL
jgi:Domain of unknown function (DUF397)